MTSGVTDAGFVLKDYESVLADLQARARQYLGQDVDLNDYSPLGQMFGSIAYELARHWQILEAVYYAGFIDTAAGANLDRVIAVLNIDRNPATRARGTVIFSRTVPGPGLVIPAGVQVSTPDGITFSTIAPAVLPAEALSVEVEVLADLPGAAGNVAAARISTIVSPVAGIETVTNPAAMTGGSDTESDATLRARAKAYAPTARGTVEALESALQDIDGVTAVGIEEDFETCSVVCTVAGGDDAVIAVTIGQTRPAGVLVDWQRPSYIPIAVTCTLRKSAGSTEEQVKTSVTQAINAYINDLLLGETVDYSDVVSAIVTADGVDSLLACSATDGTITIDAFGETIAVPAGSKPQPGAHSITVIT